MKKVKLIDTHCHLDFPVFSDDREALLAQCLEQHVASLIVPGVCQKDWEHLLALCESHSQLFPALGLHPCFMHMHQASDLDELEHYCERHTPVAIGEIGLDFFVLQNEGDQDRKERQRQQQIELFAEQLQIASQYQLPVLIHARKSHDEVLRHLKTVPAVNGIIHAYSGSYEQAREYLKSGFKLGFGGAYTYPQATKLRSLVAKLPLDAWVFETDAPDMTPFEHHGQRNSPVYLTEIAEAFVQLYEEHSNSDVILAQLYENTRAVFPFLPAS
jgi:TatD DNase family protein